MLVMGLLITVVLSGAVDGLETQFQYTAEFLCHIVEWYL